MGYLYSKSHTARVKLHRSSPKMNLKLISKQIFAAVEIQKRLSAESGQSLIRPTAEWGRQINPLISYGTCDGN